MTEIGLLEANYETNNDNESNAKNAATGYGFSDVLSLLIEQFSRCRKQCLKVDLITWMESGLVFFHSFFVSIFWYSI